MRNLLLAFLLPLAACDRGPPVARPASDRAEGSVELVTRFTRHQGEAREMAFTPDGRLLAGTGADGRIALMRASDGAPWRTFSHPGGATSLALSPDGSLLVSGGYDRSARMW
ncbi:MAG TPA: hypothetical protein VEA60_00190, partial [Allosphingosinicella sp.]|nr:hypothetical protein [Allosphingosinicella sp.]